MILRKLIPKPIRKMVRNILVRIEKYKVLRFLQSVQLNCEQRKLLEYLKEDGISCVPYAFSKNYDWKKVQVFKDSCHGMYYVKWGGGRMYLKRSMDEETVKRYVNGLLIEQDQVSPHRYLKENFFAAKQMILADLGAAEGSFSLSIIDRCSKVYLFECDPEWIEPLQLTFAPWNEKVVIIPRFIGNVNDAESITLDTYFKDKEIECLKADIEGAEIACLMGGETVIRDKIREIAICAYHSADAEEKIKEILNRYGYETSVSPGYMVWNLNQDTKTKEASRYLRKGLVYAKKNRLS